MNWYLEVLKKYFVFEGRARRKEYWMFILVNFIIVIGLSLIESVLGTGGALSLVYNLAVLIPGLAVGARRLHDTDRSAWWLLIGLIPFIGWLVLIVFFALPGQDGPNKYGPSPIAA